MSEFFSEYGMFLAKTVTIVVAVLLVIGVGAASVKGEKKRKRFRLEVRNLNEHFKTLRDTLKFELLPEAERKQEKKAKKKEKKQAKKEKKKKGKTGEERRKHIFVLNFRGDILASAVSHLREEVTAVLMVARPGDEVVLRLESSGGMVNTYGLAASQLLRIREADIPLTVVVDKVAASGGYMMACVGSRVIAAPFAILGSIGVITESPNFHRFLKKHDIDYEQITAGKYKRTLTLFGENTDEARQKAVEQIEDIHALFKEFVAENRPQVEIEKVATGEYWFGKRALEVKLVDALQTSDDYLVKASEQADIIEVCYKPQDGLRSKLTLGFEHVLNRILSL